MIRCDLRLGRRRGAAVRGTLVIVVGHIEAELENESVTRSHRIKLSQSRRGVHN